MIRKIFEHEYYMEIEDQLYNQGLEAALLFISKNDPISDEILKKLYEVKDSIKKPVFILDVEEAFSVTENFCIYIDKDIPDLILFNGDGNNEIFRYSSTTIDAIVDMLINL